MERKVIITISPLDETATMNDKALKLWVNGLFKAQGYAMIGVKVIGGKSMSILGVVEQLDYVTATELFRDSKELWNVLTESPKWTSGDNELSLVTLDTILEGIAGLEAEGLETEIQSVQRFADQLNHIGTVYVDVENGP